MYWNGAPRATGWPQAKPGAWPAAWAPGFYGHPRGISLPRRNQPAAAKGLRRACPARHPNSYNMTYI